MEVTIQKGDIKRGAEFVCRERSAILVAEGNRGLQLVYVNAARVGAEGLNEEKIAEMLNRSGAVPRWLHEAREVERRAEEERVKD